MNKIPIIAPQIYDAMCHTHPYYKYSLLAIFDQTDLHAVIIENLLNDCQGQHGGRKYAQRLK